MKASRIFFILLLSTLACLPARAASTCHGRFANPITDI
jgi:hypothetical protein